MTDHESAGRRPRAAWRGSASGSANARTPRRRRVLRNLLVILASALVVSFLTEAFLIRTFYIPTGSMQDTLQIDDRIIVNELVPDVVDIDRGDIVVFRDPGGWLGPVAPAPIEAGNTVVDGIQWLAAEAGLRVPDSDDHLVKRVIGLPGDDVACCDAAGSTTVNGEPITEPYLKLPPGAIRTSEYDFSVTVPAGGLWVEGDNRYNSADSRLHTDTPGNGFVPVSHVVGRAFVINWPLSHWSWLGG
ncbi:signal peptidase I [Cryobacterium sp. TMT2-17-1]|uniref:signal peptidase I n=1 Tax=unclassified Cryobacterium TaxID=2649013 RepID=UPI001069AB54|nr:MULTISPECIES: signal peptidase I [unclassified Cryobacterium]TFC49331.1 signal peptidase I [Cryobacterium sp. TMT2-17-1]TFC70770.1 signal peptidase I [Cryobacterium sp. TMT2-4]